MNRKCSFLVEPLALMNASMPMQLGMSSSAQSSAVVAGNFQERWCRPALPHPLPCRSLHHCGGLHGGHTADVEADREAQPARDGGYARLRVRLICRSSAQSQTCRMWMWHFMPPGRRTPPAGQWCCGGSLAQQWICCSSWGKLCAASRQMRCG